MTDKKRGLFNKFNVERTDGKSEPGEKHHGCKYFVLDMDHDKHACAALEAYATSCESDYPLLAKDLLGKINPKPDVGSWPDILRLRNTNLRDDLGGMGQRIFTTAGAGYEKRPYHSQAALDAAVKAERERCVMKARLAMVDNPSADELTCSICAAAIRAKPETTAPSDATETLAQEGGEG